MTLLPQKLKQAPTPFANHFIGKGHLGYPTTDHLPFHRGFDSHAGYLGPSVRRPPSLARTCCCAHAGSRLILGHSAGGRTRCRSGLARKNAQRPG